MKAFIFSLCIVLSLVVLITINAFFMNSVTSELIDAARHTSLDSGYEVLNELWESNKLFISISASHKEIDKIEEQIQLLCVATEARSEGELKKAQTLLINYIEQIKQHEELSLDNIL